jgi:hypothetical protein
MEVKIVKNTRGLDKTGQGRFRPEGEYTKVPGINKKSG